MTPQERLQAIKTELTTDPLNRGYASLDDEQAARAFSRPDRTVDREQLPSGVLVSCLDKADFAALAAADRTYLNLFVSASDVPITAAVKQVLAGMFAAGTTTRANIVQAMQRSGSRAIELGLGNVTASDIADAKRI